MKRLVVCCDGTWNTPEQEEQGGAAPTNVVKLYHCVLERDGQGVEQLRYYHPGVGTEGGLLARVAGGAYGLGLSRNIKSAYAWLGQHYRDGDEVFLFGFSRGAYTVRSLAGMLGRGLLDLEGVDDRTLWSRVDAAYDRYRKKNPEPLTAPVHADAHALPIRFLGVWDTVGALGVPNDLAILNMLDNPAAWSFHDTRLGAHIECARHAIALDEQRASFTPTLWTAVENRDVQQLWFPGTHGDVGGGHAAVGLPDIGLLWMLEEASATRQERPGLGTHEEMRTQLRPDPHAPQHESLRGVFKALRTRPRGIPAVREGSHELHPSALARKRTPPITQGAYHPTRSLAAGESAAVRVFARERWNATGLYLARGRYRFEAAGEWLDDRIRCGPGGTDDSRFHIGELAHLVGNALGWLEKGFQSLTRNEDADFLGTRRLEDVPWFALVGVVANDLHGANPENDGSPRRHEEFAIGEGVEHDVSAEGYLYAFANDAWAFYDNNRGSVRLTITRL